MTERELERARDPYPSWRGFGDRQVAEGQVVHRARAVASTTARIVSEMGDT